MHISHVCPRGCAWLLHRRMYPCAAALTGWGLRPAALHAALHPPADLVQPVAAPELTVPCRCVPIVTPFVHKKIAWAGVVLPVLVAMLVAMLVAFHMLRTLRPGLQQDAKAQAAASKANSITLVLVDIEGSDELCRWNQMVGDSQSRACTSQSVHAAPRMQSAQHPAVGLPYLQAATVVNVP